MGPVETQSKPGQGDLEPEAPAGPSTLIVGELKVNPLIDTRAAGTSACSRAKRLRALSMPLTASYIATVTIVQQPAGIGSADVCRPNALHRVLRPAGDDVSRESQRWHTDDASEYSDADEPRQIPTNDARSVESIHDSPREFSLCASRLRRGENRFSRGHCVEQVRCHASHAGGSHSNNCWSC